VLTKSIQESATERWSTWSSQSLRSIGKQVNREALLVDSGNRFGPKNSLLWIGLTYYSFLLWIPACCGIDDLVFNPFRFIGGLGVELYCRSRTDDILEIAPCKKHEGSFSLP